MAASPSHQFGQIVGLVLESAIGPPLEKTAKKHGFYLDSKRPRKARDGKKKVVWVDGQGNAHDLDFVIEEGGSEARIGVPKAFIEIAWRRYTKHSRNKAQEIQGALAPLAERYSDSHPFLGVVLAGDFTDGSLNQLLSHGFCILHFPYGCVVEAFSEAGIDASFDENTPDKQFARKVKQFKKLGEAAKGRLAEGLRDRERLCASLARRPSHPQGCG
jgi:hypothetical protein